MEHRRFASAKPRRSHRLSATPVALAVVAVAALIGTGASLPFRFAAPAAHAQTGGATAKKADPFAGGTPVIPDDALFVTPIAGAENTNAVRTVIPVPGDSSARVARFSIRKATTETNATQLIIPTTAAIEKGDALIARFDLIGSGLDNKGANNDKPAEVTIGFEKNGAPWTKSLFQVARGERGLLGMVWTPVVVAFTAAESYKPGEAMVSLRLAHGPQTVLVGGLSVINLGKGKTGDDLAALIADQTPLGAATVRVNARNVRQTMVGFGGNFARAMYADEANDAVGRYLLDALKPAHARIAIPLPQWEPANDNADPVVADANGFKDEGRVHGTFLLLQEMQKRGIKDLVASAWDVPNWMVEDASKKTQRRIAKDKYGEAVESLAQFLVTARDKYGVTVSYVSFNESDGGYSVIFAPNDLATFIKLAGPRFKALGLSTKWLTGDTSNGRALVAFARPQLEDAECRPFLGPISFHSWDALSASPDDYRAIATLAKKYDRPVWCLEAGWDAQAWQANPSPFPTWDNALKIALVNARAVGDAGAQVVDYWQYQRDYPLAEVADDGKATTYPAFTVIQQMARGLPKGSRVVAAASDKESLQVIAARGPAGFTSVQLVNRAGAGTVKITGLPPRMPLTLTHTTRTARMVSPRRFYTTDAKGTVTVPVASLSVTLLSGRNER